MILILTFALATLFQDPRLSMQDSFVNIKNLYIVYVYMYMYNKISKISTVISIEYGSSSDYNIVLIVYFYFKSN